jgi:hypothetical protein
LSTRLINTFTAFGGGVIGGTQGHEYVEQWQAELTEVNNPLVRIVHALSNMICSIRIRWILKTSPTLTDTFATTLRILSAAVDTIAASRALSSILIGGPSIFALVGTAYLINGLALAFPTALSAPPLISALIGKWRKGRRPQPELE